MEGGARTATPAVEESPWFPKNEPLNLSCSQKTDPSQSFPKSHSTFGDMIWPAYKNATEKAASTWGLHTFVTCFVLHMD